jgi:hypothetical protein
MEFEDKADAVDLIKERSGFSHAGKVWEFHASYSPSGKAVLLRQVILNSSRLCRRSRWRHSRRVIYSCTSEKHSFSAWRKEFFTS